jgi:hypothetical protein
MMDNVPSAGSPTGTRSSDVPLSMIETVSSFSSRVSATGVTSIVAESDPTGIPTLPLKAA